MTKKLSWVVCLCLAAVSASAQVTLHGLFTDHMVLQRDVPVPVTGRAAPGEAVTVTFGRQRVSTVADQDGNWRVELKAMRAATEPAILMVAGETHTLTREHVVVGDVWLCGGQSNMEWPLQQARPTDIPSADFPLIRYFRVPPRASTSAQTSVEGAWTVCSPQTAGGFSAVGFYFARMVQQETGVPIGLINAAVGGTPIEPWIPPEGLDRIPEDRRTPARVHFTTSEWHQLYFGMIHPLTSFPVKGVLWYQGESNALFNEDAHREESYFLKKQALIETWRAAWREGLAARRAARAFPFYYVQLAAFRPPTDTPEGGDAWAMILMAQLRTLSVPGTGMAVAIDLADPRNPGDIHPRNKLDVGERLARWALAKDYGVRNMVHSGPLYRSMRVEGDRIRVQFDHAAPGLMAATKQGYEPAVEEPEGRLRRFAIAGEDRKWVWADAVIDGRSVVVSSPDVPKPVAVRYAFAMNPEGCNLYNRAGLPASPFRTDDW